MKCPNCSMPFKAGPRGCVYGTAAISCPSGGCGYTFRVSASGALEIQAEYGLGDTLALDIKALEAVMFALGYSKLKEPGHPVAVLSRYLKGGGDGRLVNMISAVIDHCNTHTARISELEALLAKREATLDAIVYKSADYDAELSQAESMTGEKWPFNEGKERAGVEIEKIIEASGYKAKPRPEDE